ncbi:MAG: 30S ribosomal protein S24e [Desulfurococcales archaeon]|nr:30S ribosomal protein S24e [Desulfurococcales archaeon]
MSTQGSLRKIDLGDGIIATVERDWYNPLIKRRELVLRIHHILKSTPMRLAVRLAVAKAYGVDVARVYVRSIRTEYGVGESVAEVHVYDSKEQALKYEPEHIIERNGGVELEGF